MRYSLLFLLICLLFVSCKPSEARHPISNNSGAFFDASIERNKQLNNREYSLIKTFIQNSEKSFKSTEYGFWYAYNTEIETNSNTPKFGDLVQLHLWAKNLRRASHLSHKRIRDSELLCRSTGIIFRFKRRFKAHERRRINDFYISITKSIRLLRR